jgi:hypothetical protein
MGTFVSKVTVALLLVITVSSTSAKEKHASGTTESRAVVATSASSPAVLTTATSPLYVTVVPRPPTDEDKENEGYDHGIKRTLDREMTRYTGFLALLALGTLAVAVLQALLFFVQLRLMRASLADTKAAANAAMLQAKSSQESAETARTSMIASERAYVHFAGLRYISHTYLGDGHVFWRLRPHWRNSGNTPTRGLQVYVHYELLDAALPADYPFAVAISPDETSPAISLPPSGEIVSGTSDIRGTDLAEVAKGAKHLYVWGIAKYQSVFDESDVHVTKFCVMAGNLTGDPTAPWNPKSPFNIDFAAHNRHNCADEDCNTAG